MIAAMTCWMAGERWDHPPELAWLQSWALAACQARAFFPRLVLNTDARGAALLADGLGLPFDEVITTDLPALPAEMGWLWALAKLSTYRLLAARETPFCHQDADAFWLHAPRPDLLAAPAFAQHREPPQPEQAVLHARLTVRHGALAAMPALECNAGLLGGTDCAGLYCYAADSMAMALAPANRDALSAHRDGFPACSLLEQAAFSAAFGDRAEMLLTRREPPTWELDREGWRHYAADKSGPGHVAMIEQRLHRLHPATADRVWRLMHGTCIDPGAR